MAKPALTVTITATGLLRRLRGVSKEVAKELKAELRDISREFVRTYQRRRLKGGPTSDRVGKRTGALGRSFGSQTEGQQIDDLAAHIGFGPPANPFFGGAERYARVHETGMTIRPKRGKFLAIPIEEGLTPAGVARFRSPRDVFLLRFVPIAGRGFEAGFFGFDGDALLYIFLRKVTIPPRLNFRNDWREAKPGVVRKMTEAVNRGIRKK